MVLVGLVFDGVLCCWILLWCLFVCLILIDVVVCWFVDCVRFILLFVYLLDCVCSLSVLYARFVGLVIFALAVCFALFGMRYCLLSLILLLCMVVCCVGGFAFGLWVDCFFACFSWCWLLWYDALCFGFVGFGCLVGLMLMFCCLVLNILRGSVV